MNSFVTRFVIRFLFFRYQNDILAYPRLGIVEEPNRVFAPRNGRLK